MRKICFILFFCLVSCASKNISGGNSLNINQVYNSVSQINIYDEDENIAITDTAIAGLGAGNCALSGAFTGANGTTLELVHNGTGWLEVSRSVNG